ncbi:hypothetical protein C6P45_000298 [Maudiozyma exigua]|uniref:Uncharacterized protein n=1 Tax=Maudiozyma exigua TaxID=34358 RepID=A0A9P6W9M5_MAUEX|nr:hypothetical protein C6P45_000298 [Kazachstania exigua]
MEDNNTIHYKPKISVISQNSLYLLKYSEIDGRNPSYNAELIQSCKNFNILFYIDIPTIDYYNDELNDMKLMKFNKKFKLNLLKNLIWDSFVDNNQEFWSQLSTVHHNPLNCKLTINTSGSIRYVETIKFLIESIYKRLKGIDNVTLKINLNVSNLTLKWFKTFLNNDVLESNIINFINLGYHHYTIQSESNINLLSDQKMLVQSPFKDYFTKLNNKFSNQANNIGRDPHTIESIVIILNSTGIKALLTILSDKPLTNFISQDSIDQIFDDSTMSLQGKSLSPPQIQPQQIDSSKPIPLPVHNPGHKRTDSKESIKRESLSLMHFQNNILTSNKDKSVRVRSQSINTKPYHHTNKVILNSIPIRNSNSNTNLAIPSIRISPSPQLIPERNITPIETENYINEEDEDEQDSSSSNDEDEYDDDEDGISFYVPSLLSRTASSQYIHDENSNDLANNGSISTNCSDSAATSTTMKKGRFRSLSLMDPAQKAPFYQYNNSIVNNSVRDTLNNSRSFSNIYIHDGDFQGDANPKNGIKTIKRKRKYTLNGNLNTVPTNLPTGLIPPEFYSKMSSPSTSANSSNASIANMNTFNSPNNSNKLSNSSTVKLFEKNLINNSLDELRKIKTDHESKQTLQKTSPIFTLESNPYKFPHRNAFALNFSKPQHSNVLSMDEEDKLMMGAPDTSVVGTPVKLKASPIIQNLTPEIDYGSKHKRLNTPEPIKDTNTNFLNFRLYDDDDDGKDANKEDSTDDFDSPTIGLGLYPKKTSHDDGAATPHTTAELGSKFKKVLSFDLYGDSDKDGEKFWMLGHNK